MIGFLDSGSGGLTVLDACRRALPHRHYVYFGDHAHTPYGTRDAKDIQNLTQRGVSLLFERGCHLVILACNTAAAVALRSLQQDWLQNQHPGRRVLGVHIPLIEGLTGTLWADKRPRPGTPDRTIAVFATPATIACGAFETEIARRGGGIDVIGQACPGLADAIEQGADESYLCDLIEGFWQACLTRPGGNTIDSVVLACTHYPLISDLFAKILPQTIQILTQPAIVAGALTGYLARNPGLSVRSAPRLDLLTSGVPDMVARTAWLPDTYRHFIQA